MGQHTETVDRSFQIDRESLANSGIPEYMHGGIIRFYENGIPPGGFLIAVIDNDLREACARADDTNRHRLFEYMAWFYNSAPSGTWGYQGAVNQYLKWFHGEE
jgi:hypothetical protein